MNFYKSKQWKRKRLIILRRDSYECKECKRYGKNRTATTIHHCHPLNVRPDLRLTNWNLISLCNKCHEQMHTRAGDELTELGIYWRNKVTPHPMTS
ncbi:HNH endonuclease [Solibacillus sp. FSL K6-1523]|uniref:HNH endonuclease n=1 Tax=Solibacillus sp. FSL K6-1523 TaxID=2921471 RepID=UPI0030FAFBD1